MGKTLNLLDHLAARARHLLGHEQSQAVVALLRPYVRIAAWPAAGAAELHTLLGEALLNLGEFRDARRHLRESLRLEPGSAVANHRLAQAIERDPQADAMRAGKAYRRALELAPRDVRLLADAGAYFAQLGRERKGLALLATARELEPENLDLIRKQVETLCELERFDDALRAIRIAAFRLKREPRLAQLREQVEFRQARLQQRRDERQAVRNTADEPVLLPFLSVVGDRPRTTGTRYRRDVISKIRPHLPRTPRRLDSNRSG